MYITYEERMKFKNQINSIIKDMDKKAQKIKEDQLKSKKLGSFYNKLHNKGCKHNCEEDH